MRSFPGNDEDIQAVSDWVAKRAIDAAEVAIHYVKFAGDSTPTRYSPSTARELAVRILQTTGEIAHACRH